MFLTSIHLHGLHKGKQLIFHAAKCLKTLNPFSLHEPPPHGGLAFASGCTPFDEHQSSPCATLRFLAAHPNVSPNHPSPSSHQFVKSWSDALNLRTRLQLFSCSGGLTFSQLSQFVSSPYCFSAGPESFSVALSQPTSILTESPVATSSAVSSLFLYTAAKS